MSLRQQKTMFQKEITVAFLEALVQNGGKKKMFQNIRGMSR